MEISETPRLIGRGSHVDLRLDDSSVSSSHAEVIRRQGAFWIKDLNSTNGVWVNGDRVDREVCLKPGDRIEIGSFTLQLVGSLLVEAAPEMGKTEIRPRQQWSPPSQTNPNMQRPQTAAPSPLREVNSAVSENLSQAPVLRNSVQPGRGLGIAGLVCGIVAFLLLPIVLGPLGIIFGAVSWSKGNKIGMAATIVSICGLIVGMILGYVVWNA